MFPRLLLLLLVVSGLFCWAPDVQPVSAHAYLKSTNPLAEAQLNSAPEEIRLVYSEKVKPEFSEIRVQRAGSSEWLEAELSTPDEMTLVMALPALESGDYRVEWKILSVDTHVSQGSFGFSVQLPGAEQPVIEPPDTTPTSPPAADHSHHTSDAHQHDSGWQAALHRILRVLDVLVVAVVGGYIFFQYAVLGRADRNLRSELRLYALGFVLSLLTGAAHIWHLSTQFDGFSKLLISTMLGNAVMFKTTAFLLLVLLGLYERASRSRLVSSQAVPVLLGWPKLSLIALVILLFPLTGHAFAAEQLVGFSVVLHALHMATVICWFGGLVGLALRARSLVSTEHLVSAEHLSNLHRWTVRFAAWALPLLAITTLTGAASALNKFSAFVQWWQTDYGLILSAKLFLLILIWLLATFHRLWLMPRLSRHISTGENSVSEASDKGNPAGPHLSPKTLLRVYQLEIILALAALVLAGALAVTPPPM